MWAPTSAMRIHQIPRPLLQLLATILFTPRFTTAAPNANALLGAIQFNDLFGRDSCGGQLCGYYSQLCCTAGSGCYTDANSIASCTPTVTAATQAATGGGGYWTYITTTFLETETDTVMTTEVLRSYVTAGVAPTAVATAVCAANEPQCGSICCATDQFCFNFSAGQCSAIDYGGSGSSTLYYSTPYSTSNPTAVPPFLGTSSVETTVVATVSPSTTVPFVSPVATGSNVTVTSSEQSHSGLSGGAIAGIVIGVLLGLALLGLIIFYCCLRGLFGLFGFGKKRKRTTEVEEYERRTHHASGGGRRTWYGGTARPPARVDRKEKSHEGRNLLGLGVGLAALWAFLGLKRRRQQRRQDEKYSEYSYSSDYYTSASSASSDDRRTHPTRHSRR